MAEITLECSDHKNLVGANADIWGSTRSRHGRLDIRVFVLWSSHLGGKKEGGKKEGKCGREEKKGERKGEKKEGRGEGERKEVGKGGGREGAREEWRKGGREGETGRMKREGEKAGREVCTTYFFIWNAEIEFTCCYLTKANSILNKWQWGHFASTKKKVHISLRAIFLSH